MEGIVPKHHYVPKSFLAAWTDTGTLDGQLCVIDKTTGRTWRVRPANAGAERDLYLVDVSEIEDDLSDDVIESHFGMVEDAAIPVIKQLNEGDDLASDADRENLIAFLAVSALRVPSRLRWTEGILRQLLEAEYRQLEADGKFASGDSELDARMKEWFDQGLISININQNAPLAMTFSMLTQLMNLLLLRHWTVLSVIEDAGDLVCTDNPLLLRWIKPVPDGYSPGFELKNTVVFTPVGPRTALLGMWSAEPVDRVLTNQQVAFWNGELLGSVDRFVFMRGNFQAMHRTGVIDEMEDVRRRWTAASR